MIEIKFAEWTWADRSAQLIAARVAGQSSRFQIFIRNKDGQWVAFTPELDHQQMTNYYGHVNPYDRRPSVGPELAAWLDNVAATQIPGGPL